MVPWGSANAENFSVFGAACALGAGFCWAIYIYFGQKVVQQNIGMHALTIAIIISALALLPIGLYQDAPALVQTQHWGKVLMVALLATAIPYALDLLALKSLSKLSYGTLQSLTCTGCAGWHGPVKEQINTWQWIALGCIMLASVGVTVGTSKRSRQPVTDF